MQWLSVLASAVDCASLISFWETCQSITQAGSCSPWFIWSFPATFHCCLLMELLESLLGGWWMRKTPIHQSFTFRRQKIPMHYLLNCQISGKIRRRTALTGFTWNCRWHPPAVRVGWDVWHSIPERSSFLRGRFGTGHGNAELRLWSCSLAISHVQREIEWFFCWEGIMTYGGGRTNKNGPWCKIECLPAKMTKMPSCPLLLWAEVVVLPKQRWGSTWWVSWLSFGEEGRLVG